MQSATICECMKTWENGIVGHACLKLLPLKSMYFVLCLFKYGIPQ